MRHATRLGLSWLFVAGVSCGGEAEVADAPVQGVTAPSLAVCDNDTLGNGGCFAGACRLYSSSRPLPSGAVVGLTESAVTAELAPDAVGNTLCTVQWPTADRPADLNLSIKLADPTPDTMLFEHRANGDDVLLDVSGPGDGAVVALLRGSGTFGIAKKPAPWNIERSVGMEALLSSDGPSWLRNAAHEWTYGAFFDGAHLFVANGPRIFVYNGIPTNPLAKPDLVLGQPDLDSLVGVTSGALFGSAAVVALWSDGTRLVATTGHRVLVWQKLPTQSMTPADLVLGQPDLSSNRVNAGGVAGAGTMASPVSVTSDGTRLYVADSMNERVLGWSTFPTASSTPADIVLGQPDFVSTAPFSGNLPMYIPEGVAATPNGLYVSGMGGPGLSFVSNPGVNASASYDVYKWQSALQPGGGVARPSGIAHLAGGGIAIRDFGLMRIACTRNPAMGPSAADFLLGQPDAERVVPMRFADGQYVNPARVDASNISLNIGVSSTASGSLLVPDSRRLLVFDSPPSYNYEPASRVLGQAGFTVNERADYRAVSGATLASPAGVSVKNGMVAVADRSNNRVLVWKAEDLGSVVQSASIVVGQPDERSFVANGDIVSASASTLSGPEGVVLDGTHLVVADTQNHRVLVWNGVPQANGRPADIVLGQADFKGRRPNHGRVDVSPVDGFSDADADGFFYPTDVASDGTHLFVADRLNHRVLVWDSFPTKSGQAADRVLGQPSMSSVRANYGGGAFAVAAAGLNLPSGLSLDGTTLWIADTENNRVVRWENATSAGGTPTAWLGQPNGSTITTSPYERTGYWAGSDAQTLPVTTSSSVLRPRKVIAAGGKLFVSELDSNRVHVFDGASLASIGALGQANLTSANPNATGIGAATLAEPMGLASDGTDVWVADARNHRVLGYPLGTVTTGMAATKVLGQANMLGVGFNRSSVAAAGATSQPRAISVSGDVAFVADTGNSRILQQRIAGDTWTVERVFGQPSDSLALANAGGAPTASSMSRPRGVWADTTNLVVADTDNHRALIFDRLGADGAARVVLGQSSFASVSPSAGAAGMNLPSGVCSDGTKLAVVDTGNHRVLVWNALPTAAGAPADVILGQATPTDVAPNRGSSTASAATMAYPSACVVRGDSLFVADTGNNRVLRFVLAGLANGAAATSVLGQPDDASRVPAGTVLDTDHLAGPAGLSADATNLYVAERDLGRVVVFGPQGKVTEYLGGLGSSSLLRAGDGVAAVPTGLFTTRLYVSETGSDRVSIIGSVSRLQSR